MTARWGYEALVVEQFMHNDYDAKFYTVNKAMSIAEYKKNYWIKELEKKVDYIESNLNALPKPPKFKTAVDLLRNELTHELPVIKKIPISHIQNIEFPALTRLTPDSVNMDVIKQTREFMKVSEQDLYADLQQCQ